VFDPRGGYFKAGGVYMPSIVAEIGCVIETHLKMIGLLHDPEMSAEQRNLIAEKRAAYVSRAKKPSAAPDSSAKAAAAVADSAAPADAPEGSFPAGATLCGKCNTSAVIIMDGCATCLNCGYSKCG
jgi:hypothetical protein